MLPLEVKLIIANKELRMMIVNVKYVLSVIT